MKMSQIWKWVLLLQLVTVSLGAQDDSSKQEYIASIEEYRQKYFDQYLTDPRAPYTADDTVHIHFYDPDPKWVLAAEMKLEADAKPFDMALYSGITRRFVKYGTLHFEIAGAQHTLAVYQDLTRMSPMTRHRLFLPFMDITNGTDTYGGGRYMDLSTNDIDGVGKVVLDFNKAYNPWCAYSDGFNCPIPPRENHLKIAVEAGEKNFTKEQ